MIRSTQVFSALICLVCTALALAENKVIGTVELTIDGEEQTWYVLHADGATLPTAFWHTVGPEKATLSITAFPDPAVTFSLDADTGYAVPVGEGAVLVITVGFPVGASEQIYQLPTQSVRPASVMLLPTWTEPLSSYDISVDPGEIRLSTIDADSEGLSTFKGSFRGVLRNDDDETKVVEDARFEVTDVPLFR